MKKRSNHDPARLSIGKGCPLKGFIFKCTGLSNTSAWFFFLIQFGPGHKIKLETLPPTQIQDPHFLLFSDMWGNELTLSLPFYHRISNVNAASQWAKSLKRQKRFNNNLKSCVLLQNAGVCEIHRTLFLPGFLGITWGDFVAPCSWVIWVNCSPLNRLFWDFPLFDLSLFHIEREIAAVRGWNN